MKEHVRSGAILLKELEMPEILQQMALFHHESYDGSGYLFSLTGEEIPLPGRISAIADIYSAIITERSYKQARKHEEALKIIKKEEHRFDPIIFREFFKQAPSYQQIILGATTLKDYK
jgi:HD-GYP domain-containing protein (c-di-GMP phosphodiesterase class II)